ncbi:hypothetical protein SUGI_0990480 [Cryptomeria japonica]|nr:hypothetical protein SUGI_0990480 [Cryptomeria japonica]
MLKKKQKIDEINDLCGLRLIVLNEKECYDAHRIVHHLWQDWLFQYTFRYQSLHTVVWGEDGHPLEIQIRTKEMHQQGSFVYKEGEVEHSSSIVQMVEWARWVLSEMMDTKLRLSYQESSLRSPCPFPFHKDGWPHMDKFCELPFCTDENLFVIVLEDDKCARSMFNGYVKNTMSFPLFVTLGTPHKIPTPIHRETLKVGSFIYSKVNRCDQFCSIKNFIQIFAFINVQLFNSVLVQAEINTCISDSQWHFWS